VSVLVLAKEVILLFGKQKLLKAIK